MLSWWLEESCESEGEEWESLMDEVKVVAAMKSELGSRAVCW